MLACLTQQEAFQVLPERARHPLFKGFADSRLVEEAAVQKGRSHRLSGSAVRCEAGGHGAVRKQGAQQGGERRLHRLPLGQEGFDRVRRNRPGEKLDHTLPYLHLGKIPSPLLERDPTLYGQGLAPHKNAVSISRQAVQDPKGHRLSVP